MKPIQPHCGEDGARRRFDRLLSAAEAAAVLLSTLLTVLIVSSAAAAPAAWYYMLAGTRLAAFTEAPILTVDGRQYLSARLLDELGLPSGPAASAQTGIMEAAVRGPETHSYILGSHELTLNAPGQPPGGALDGEALPASVLRSFGGKPYLSADALANLGLTLCFNPAQNLPQLCGRVTEMNYDAERSRLVISALTPFRVQGRQEDGGVTLELEGALIEAQPPREYSSGPISRLAVKSLPAQGRSFVYLKQPQRTGFRIRSEVGQGFASIDFGNYFQLASTALTSSGEISINVQLGAPVRAEAQMLDSPPRLVLDFSGAEYEDATEYVEVNAGHCSRLRIGQPEPGRVRVVADLSQKLDFRLLSTDGGARYYCQLLPLAQTSASIPGSNGLSRQTEPGTVTEVSSSGTSKGQHASAPLFIDQQASSRPALGSRNRVIMLDAGHGGSDPGASGVLTGVNEKSLTLKLARLTQAELERLGYRVLQTRSDDRFVSLGARTDYANLVLPWIFVSLHCNSIDQPDFNGAMTFHHPAASGASQALAASVQQSIVSATGATDKGVREANFFVLRETVMPSILIEAGFLSNRDECGRLCDEGYQRRLATAIAQGIDRFVLEQ